MAAHALTSCKCHGPKSQPSAELPKTDFVKIRPGHLVRLCSVPRAYEEPASLEAPVDLAHPWDPIKRLTEGLRPEDTSIWVSPK